MATKTCGELPSCANFEQKIITNGDKIISGGNRELAEFGMQIRFNKCRYCVYREGYSQCKCPPDKHCTDGIEAWLNAPAEREEREDK